MKILFLSAWYPYPPNNGSKLRIYNLIHKLARQHEVTLLSFIDQADANPNTTALHTLCQEVHVVPWKRFEPQSLRARLSYFSLRPRSVVDTFSPQMACLIEQALANHDYDLVIASELGMAGYGRYLQGMPALFEDVELGVMYEQFANAPSLVRRLRFGLTWLKHRGYLAGLLRHFHACTVVSEREKRLLATAVPGEQVIEIIPNCINLSDYQGIHARVKSNTLIFAGALTFDANYHAMLWFLREVYPCIQAQAPDVHLTITGDHANLPLPQADSVTLTGFVDDVRPLIASSWISLAPIWHGGGTRLKILEAMALHTPVVATSKGAEGLNVHHGEHLLIANTPQVFADAIIRLLGDPELRERLADNAYQLMRKEYDWAVVMPRFLDLVERIARTQRSAKITQP